MLFFWSEDLCEQWINRHQTPHDGMMSVQTLWALAKAWYHNRLSPDYAGRSLEEAVAILESVGLSSDFWKP